MLQFIGPSMQKVVVVEGVTLTYKVIEIASCELSIETYKQKGGEGVLTCSVLNRT